MVLDALLPISAGTNGRPNSKSYPSLAVKDISLDKLPDNPPDFVCPLVDKTMVQLHKVAFAIRLGTSTPFG
jgi:hypothetical protein